MSIDQNAILKSIYDTIFSTSAGAGAQGSSYLTMQFPAAPVDSSLYENSWSPRNLGGSHAASEQFARLVDGTPALSPLHRPSGDSVEKLYREVLHATVQPTPEDPKEKADYEQQLSYLESREYKEYLKKKAAYDSAVVALTAQQKNFDLSKPADQQQWAILAARLQAAIDGAWRELQTTQPGKAEAALATVSQYRSSTREKLFSGALASFDSSAQPSSREGGQTYHLSEAAPPDWSSDSGLRRLTAVTITSHSQSSSAQTQSGTWAKDLGIDPGLLRIERNGSWTSTDVSTDASQLEISFRFGRVEIKRPWLRTSLLSLDGWSVPTRDRLAYSNGKLDGSNRGIWPLLSVAFYLVGDIQISASWGQKDVDFITAHLSSGDSLAIGPFLVSGPTVRGTFDGTTLQIPGLQIIAWQNQVVPASPPLKNY